MHRFTIHFHGTPRTNEYKEEDQIFTHGTTVLYAEDVTAAMKKFKQINFGDMRPKITKVE